MRKRFFLFAAIASLLLGACSDDDVKPEPKPGSGKGMLVVKASLQLISDDAGAEGQAALPIDFTGYSLTLKGPEGTQELDFVENDTIEDLAVGKYELTLSSHKTAFTEPAFEMPVYKGTVEAIIVEDEITETNVLATQDNAGVFFVYDASLEETQYADIVPAVGYEGKALSFVDADRERKGYFPAGNLAIALKGGEKELLIEGEAEKLLAVEAAQLWKMTLKADEKNTNLILTVVEINDPQNVLTWKVGPVPPPVEGTPIEGSALIDYPEGQAATITTLTVTGAIPSEEAWRALNKFTALEHLVLYDENGIMPDYLFYDESAKRPTMPQLISVKAPYLTGIGSHSLFASNIQTLEMPVLKSIGHFGLAGCMNLETLSFPELETLENYALSECIGLTSVDMPKVGMLAQGTFDMCKKLVEVNLPNATEAGSGVFFRCDALESISLPKLVRAGDNFLSHCAMLKNAQLPELEECGKASFAVCTSLESLDALHMPKLQAITEDMFYRCEKLTEASHSNIQSIGNRAFQECFALQHLSFASVLNVGVQAFESCTALQSASMPKAETISEKAFYKCTVLTTVDISSAKQVMDFAFCLDYELTNLNMSAVEVLGNSAFYNTKIVTLDMPKLISCGKETFRKCTALESVSMAKLTALSNYMFGECTALKIVNAPAVETSADGHAFNGCSAIERVSFPAMKIVGNNLFSGAVSLKEIALPIAETIGNNVFARASLTEINLPKAVTLGTYVFDRCEKLTKVQLPLVNTVGNYAFTSCTGLETLELPNVLTISLGTFNGCTALKNVSLPVVNNIGKWAFRNCTALTELRLGTTEEITFGDLVFAHLPVQDPQTITPNCDLKLNQSGAEIGNINGNVWKDYTWKSITTFTR